MQYLLRDHPAMFQQDNASSHTAKDVKEWKQANYINILSWPAGNSLDSSPIENIWDQLARQFARREVQERARTAGQVKSGMGEDSSQHRD